MADIQGDDPENDNVDGWHHHVQRALQRKETIKLLLKGLTRQRSSSRMRESASDV